VTTANIDRLLTFIQHGKPKAYGGSDMMKADFEVVAEKLARVNVLEAENGGIEYLRAQLEQAQAENVRLRQALASIETASGCAYARDMANVALKEQQQ
jgi:hypothetical protein